MLNHHAPLRPLVTGDPTRTKTRGAGQTTRDRVISTASESDLGDGRDLQAVEFPKPTGDAHHLGRRSETPARSADLPLQSGTSLPPTCHDPEAEEAEAETSWRSRSVVKQSGKERKAYQ